MNINFVSRNNVLKSRNDSSKFKPLTEAIKKLEPGGKAIEAKYETESQLNSMRNYIYTYNKKQGENIKTSSHPDKKVVYFYKN